jgi:pimeloyl-ACP methyl ester carboxylesterase
MPAPTPDAFSHILTLPDKRRLGYARYGAADGRPVIYQHGLPGSRLECQLVDACARELGISVVAPDRPGYGLSSRHNNSSLEDRALDVAALADALEIDTFSVAGVSGGAPCALACARYLPRRVTGVALVAGLGPVYDPVIRGQMAGLARSGFYLANKLPRLFELVVGGPLIQLARHRPALLVQLLARLDGGPDRRVLLDPALLTPISRGLRECFRQGLAGSLLDLQLFRRPWRLQFTAIRQPVHIWHGTRDRVVPLSHGRYYHAHLPHATLNTVEGEGHFSLPINCMRDILQIFS